MPLLNNERKGPREREKHSGSARVPPNATAISLTTLSSQAYLKLNSERG